MAKFTDVEWDDHHQYIWQCGCSDWHYLTLGWDDPDPEWRYLSLVGEYRPRGWKERVRAAWHLLRRQRYCNADLMLTDKTALELIQALREHVEKSG